MRYLREKCLHITDTSTLVQIDDSIMQDPDYSYPLPRHTYQDTPNLECVIHGRAPGQKMLFNTHLDVVPPSEGQDDAFSPYERSGCVYGRGACDAKGQVATLYALGLLLRERRAHFSGDVVFHFVVEEECGGNGTLAMVRRGVHADAAVVLEPTEMAVVPAVRGAVWFRLEVLGRAGHSGTPGATVSALDTAFAATQVLRAYHDRLLADSRGLPLFDEYADPMPVTFGMLSAGTWPASVPSKAELRGVFGFLPNRERHQVQQELRSALQSSSDAWLNEHCAISFPMLNSDGYVLPTTHPVVESLVGALGRNSIEPRVKGMTGSCDAWFYNNQAKIPTVVFGPGSLSVAHSKDECISVDDILTSASILADWVIDYGSRRK